MLESSDSVDFIELLHKPFQKSSQSLRVADLKYYVACVMKSLLAKMG